MRPRTILVIIIVLIVSPPLLMNGGLIVRGAVMKAKGYHVGITGWQLAEEIAEKHLPVTECSKIDNYPEIMQPTSEEQQESCYYEVAKLLKDPMVCEYIMPSSYGLACLGVARISMPCVLLPDYSVLWIENDAQQTSTLKDCQNSQSRSALGKQCCHIASVGLLKNVNDCSVLSGDPLAHDQCLLELADKNLDLSACASITNENIRISCDLRIKALKVDPNLCKYCTPAVERIEDAIKS